MSSPLSLPPEDALVALRQEAAEKLAVLAEQGTRPTLIHACEQAVDEFDRTLNAVRVGRSEQAESLYNLAVLRWELAQDLEAEIEKAGNTLDPLS